MKNNRVKIKSLEFFIAILLIIVLSNRKIFSQSTIYLNNNQVISYCYQPLIPSLGLHQIYAINANGENNRKIINASMGLNHHSWSADTMKFISVGYIDSGYYTWSIFSFNSNGTNLIRLTNVNNVWDSEPVWSPDMSKISFTRIYPNQNMRNELWLMNSDGSDQHFIGIDGFGAKWTKDGSKLIYTSNKNYNNSDIYVCDTSGYNEQRLTNTPLNEIFPEYSPSGNEIAYCGGLVNNNTWEIYKMSSNGTGMRQLTNNNSFDYYPRWSPDGTKFAFESDLHETGKWEIYIMDTNGMNVWRVTYLPVNITAINPVWRPEQTTHIKKINGNLPEDCRLFQNYPNPFNSVTKIEFSIIKRNFVTIEVFNVLGMRVILLVNKILNHGKYKVIFDGSNYSSGIYYYRIKAGDFTDIKKMVLIK